MRRRIISICPAVAAVMLVASCSIRNAKIGVAAPVTRTEPLQPAPKWVAGAVASAASDVQFAFGAADLTPADRDNIERASPSLVQILDDFPELVIALEGNCDDRGSIDFNRQLGKRRAEAVKAALVASGFPPAHLRVTTYSALRPLSFTQDESCRQKNRRVHLNALQLPTQRGGGT